jgi:hypothetical protein
VPVYEVRREDGFGKPRTLHRNMLLPIGHLALRDNDQAGARQRRVARPRRPRASSSDGDASVSSTSESTSSEPEFVVGPGRARIDPLTGQVTPESSSGTDNLVRPVATVVGSGSGASGSETQVSGTSSDQASRASNHSTEGMSEAGPGAATDGSGSVGSGDVEQATHTERERPSASAGPSDGAASEQGQVRRSQRARQPPQRLGFPVNHAPVFPANFQVPPPFLWPPYLWQPYAQNPNWVMM